MRQARSWPFQQLRSDRDRCARGEKREKSNKECHGPCTAARASSAEYLQAAARPPAGTQSTTHDNSWQSFTDQSFHSRVSAFCTTLSAK